METSNIKTYICPNCKNEQNQVIKVVETLEYWELDLETREVGDCLDEETGEPYAWRCPECGKDLPKSLVEELKLEQI